MYNKRKFGQHYQADLKRLSKELLVAKMKAQGRFLRLVLQNEGRCWTEFYKYVKQHKGNRENISAIKDHNDKLTTDVQVSSKSQTSISEEVQNFLTYK